MNALIDFLPVIAFVAAYWLSGFNFQIAIMVIMAAMTIQVAVTWLIKRTVSRITLISAILVVVLGGISLLLKNDLIFKWKPTVFNWAFAAAFLGSQFIGQKPLIRRLLESVSKESFTLSDTDWRTLNLMWVVFFLISGAANIYVAYNFPENVWVNFKLFGLMGMTFVFALAQAAWMARRQPEDPGAADGDPQ